jgi:hypothetical protein
VNIKISHFCLFSKSSSQIYISLEKIIRKNFIKKNNNYMFVYTFLKFYHMKKIITILIMTSIHVIGKSQTEVGGAYFSDQNWTVESSPYRIISDVQIPIGYSLNIEPGVLIEYTGAFEIFVKGKIIANALDGDSIIFQCSDGVSTGVNLIRFSDTDLSNTILENVVLKDGEFAIKIENNCSNILRVNSSQIMYSKINLNSTNAKLEIINSKLIKSSVLLQGSGTANSGLTVDSSSIDSCSFITNIPNVNYYGLYIRNSILKNTDLRSGSSGSSDDARFELNNIRAENCRFSTVYGKGIINNSRILNSSFTNKHTTQACQVFFDINNTIIVNSNFVSSVLSNSNSWWSNFKFNRCVIKLDTNNVFGLERVEMYNSILVGDLDSSELILYGGTFSNSTITQNKIGLRKLDNLNLSISNSNIFNNLDFNIYNNSNLNIQALTSYWGIAETELINQSIFHYYNDINLGEVVFSNYRSIPNINAPISPPINLELDSTNGGAYLTWALNPETDLNGYMFYYGDFDGFNYQYRINIGNNTSYYIPDSLLEGNFAITAYDNSASNLDLKDKYMGKESWFTSVNKQTITYPIQIEVQNPLPTKVYTSLKENLLHIFPNPASQSVTIKLDLKYISGNIEVFDLYGRSVIYPKTFNSNQLNLDISHLANGTYFVKVVDLGGEIITKKLIKH